MDRSTENDFDFMVGHWRVHHRRLKERLAGCEDWQIFDGTCSLRQVLGGRGNIDDNVLHLPDGTYRAITLRAFDARAGRWAIWWLDDRTPHTIGLPVIGSFDEGVGTFYRDDTLNDKPIRVRFRWSDTQSAAPRWEQAYSPDAGKTWEVNWVMTFTRELGTNG